MFVFILVRLREPRRVSAGLIMAAANLLLKAAICCVFPGWMSRTARQMTAQPCVVCQPPRRKTSARGHPTIRLLRTRVYAADNSACLRLHRESGRMMERLHSVRRQRSCIVLAEEDRRFIRQAPALNGEVGRRMCCRAESTRSRQRRRKRLLEWASKEMRLLGATQA